MKVTTINVPLLDKTLLSSSQAQKETEVRKVTQFSIHFLAQFTTMGFFTKLVSYLVKFRNRDCGVIIVGLDNSGKTTIINHLMPPEQRNTAIVPTVGFSVQHFRYKGINFTAWDMSGAGKYRSLWEHHYKAALGIIFVVDSSDKLRTVVAKEELDLLLQHTAVKSRSIPILFFANKMDLRDALSSVKISQELGLDRIHDKPWNICASNAITGDGLLDGINWLSDQMVTYMSQNR